MEPMMSEELYLLLLDWDRHCPDLGARSMKLDHTLDRIFCISHSDIYGKFTSPMKMLMLNYLVRKTDHPDFLKTDKISRIKVDWTFISIYFPYGSDSKVSAYNAGDLVSIPGSGRSPGEGMATHSSILA